MTYMGGMVINVSIQLDIEFVQAVKMATPWSLFMFVLFDICYISYLNLMK